jgi:hypothetical protein
VRAWVWATFSLEGGRLPQVSAGPPHQGNIHAGNYALEPVPVVAFGPPRAATVCPGQSVRLVEVAQREAQQTLSLLGADGDLPFNTCWPRLGRFDSGGPLSEAPALDGGGVRTCALSATTRRVAATDLAGARPRQSAERTEMLGFALLHQRGGGAPGRPTSLGFKSLDWPPTSTV